MNFVIIGGDAAGMSAASRAKRNKPELNVTVLEKTMDVSYSACGMPYNIADPARDMEDLVVRGAEVFRKKQGIDLLTGRTARRVDPKNKTVSGTCVDGSGFEYPYDKLLIATGARAMIPNLPGFERPGVMVLKNLEEGRRIKAHIRTHEVKKAVIIGMGYIGLEMCEAFRELGIDVDMVKSRETFLPWMDQKLADAVESELKANQVGLYPGRRIHSIEAEGKKKLQVVCEDLVLSADMVLVAAGVLPNSEIAAAAGLKLGAGNAVSVDETLLSSDPDIYAAGDCADAVHVVSEKKVWIPLALRANRAGWAVADNVCGKAAALKGIAGTAVFKTFNMEVARTGLDVHEALDAGFDAAETVIESRSRAHAHPGSSAILVQLIGDKASGRLLGARMVGKEGVAHRINALAVALHVKMTVEEFSQSDLAYAPPFSPVWDPMLTAANQLLKQL
jgi:CoA-dependent NAD(P)H sulfur oxidoreductase